VSGHRNLSYVAIDQFPITRSRGNESSVREVLGVLKCFLFPSRRTQPDRPSEVLKFELSVLHLFVLTSPDIGRVRSSEIQERVSFWHPIEIASRQYVIRGIRKIFLDPETAYLYCQDLTVVEKKTEAAMTLFLRMQD